MAEEKISPVEAPKPPAVNPLASAASAHAATLKLKPVIRKPVIGGAKPALKMPSKPSLTKAPAPAPAAAEAVSAPVEQLKSMTQKLKGVTQQIPQQAILHKTGIIAEQKLTDDQKQSSKSRTSRISLSEAIGAAPVQSEAAPMKTIRIKRPVDLASASPAAPKAAAPAAAAAEPAAPAAKDPSLTQRKTLKITRPGAARPAAKLTTAKPAADAVKNADAPVADIADIPELPSQPTKIVAVDSSEDSDIPQGLLILDTILQFAACVAIAFLGVFLYLDLNTLWF